MIKKFIKAGLAICLATTFASAEGDVSQYNQSEITKATVLELLKKPENFKDKVVQAEGKVVKISEAIMNSNWIHIEDKEFNKVIFRSKAKTVNIGDSVVATGKAGVNVDYGYGYKYSIIMTDSEFKKK